MSIDRGDLHMKEEIGKWWEEFEKWLIEVKEGRGLKSRWNGARWVCNIFGFFKPNLHKKN